MPYTILLIDDQPSHVEYLESMVHHLLRCQVVVAPDGREAVERLLLRVEPRPCLIVVNLEMTDMSGVQLIRTIRASHKTLPIIALSAANAANTAAQAVQAGASDILPRPVNPEQLRVSLYTQLQHLALYQEQDRLSRLKEDRIHFHDIIGESAGLQSVIAQARRVTDSAIPIVIEGERGVGKEWLARAIHGSGARAGERFIIHNCLYQSDTALEALLLSLQQPHAIGCEPAGGAGVRRFSRGTLFLRHIQALSLEGQRTLLQTVRELQTGGVAPVRLIVSSTQPLLPAMRQGFFRDDLYQVLGRFVISVPALRERRADVMALAEHFVRRFSALEGRPVFGLAGECETMLARYEWPGNIRELLHCMHRAVIHCDMPWITPAHMQVNGEPSGLRGMPHHLIGGEGRVRVDLLTQEGHVRGIEELEAEVIRYAIRHYRGKMTEVARRLGIGRSTLYRKIQDYQLNVRLRQAA